MAANPFRLSTSDDAACRLWDGDTCPDGWPRSVKTYQRFAEAYYWPTKSAFFCRRRVKPGRKGRRAFGWAMPCTCWSCRECGPAQAHAALMHAIEVIKVEEQIWLTLLDNGDRAAMAALRKRRERIEDRTGEPADFLTVVRGPWRYVLSNVDLGVPSNSRRAPAAPYWGVWLESREAAWVLANTILAWPGIGATPSWSDGWRGTDQEEENEDQEEDDERRTRWWTDLLPRQQTEVEEALRAVHDWAEGFTFSSSFDLPVDVVTEDFDTAMEEAIRGVTNPP